MRLSRRWALLLLPLAVGALLRAQQAKVHGGLYMPHHEREEGYYETATSLLSAGSFGLVPNHSPSSFRAPVYPAFIALTQAPFPRASPRWTRWAQALLSSLLIAACFALGARLVSLEAGAWAAWLCALDPAQIGDVGGLNVHAYYGFMVLALGAGLVLWLERRSPRRSVLVSLLLAASLLTRSAHYPLPLLWLGAMKFWRLPGRPWRAAALVAAATALWLSPMVARNALQFKRFILLDAHKGSYVLLRSTAGPYVNSTVDQALDVAEQIEPGFNARDLPAEELYAELLRLAARNALAHPWRYAGYCLERLRLFWQGLWPYLLLAAAGLLLLRDRRGLQALAVVAFSFCGYALAGGTAEYRVSVTPLLCVLAGAGAAALLARARGRPNAPEPAFAGSLGAAMAVSGASYAAMIVFVGAELVLHPLWGGVPELPRPEGERAIEVLRQAAVYAGPKTVASRTYADVLLREAWLAVESGADARAKEMLERLGRLPNDDARGLAERASVHLRLRSFDGAEKAVRGALKREPDDARALGIRQALLVEQGRLEEAFRAALDLAKAAKDWRQREEARRRLEESFRRLKDHAAWLAGNGRLPEARRQAEVLVRESPPGALRSEALALRASLHWRGRDRARAAEDLARAMDGRPGDGPDPGARAELLALKALVRPSFDEEAGATLARAVALDAARVCRALPGFVDRGRLDRAYYEACLGRFPGDPVLLSERAVARYLGGDAAGAKDDLAAALKAQPGRADAALSLATLLCAEGRVAEALGALETASAGRLSGSRAARERALALRDGLRRTGECPR